MKKYLYSGVGESGKFKENLISDTLREKMEKETRTCFWALADDPEIVAKFDAWLATSSITKEQKRQLEEIVDDMLISSYSAGTDCGSREAYDNM